MSDRKINVPEGMLKSALGAVNNKRTVHCPACDLNDLGLILEAALLWQRENLIEPTEGQIELFLRGQGITDTGYYFSTLRSFGLYFQRCLYDAPETDVPEEVRELLWADPRYPDGIWYLPVDESKPYTSETLHHNKQVLEAYRRGQQDRK